MKKARSPAFPETAGLWTVPAPERRDERRPDAERREIVLAGFWIDHWPAREALAAIADFVDRLWQGHQRWRAMLFVGDPNNGRSGVVSRAVAAHRRNATGRIAVGGACPGPAPKGVPGAGSSRARTASTAAAPPRPGGRMRSWPWSAFPPSSSTGPTRSPARGSGPTWPP